MNYAFWVMSIAWVSATAAHAYLHEYEIKLDGSAVSGKQVVTVRFTPAETRTYDLLVFECVLRQEYTHTDSAGRTRRRVVEPAIFTHRERGVRMVEALDKHISFWVPIGVQQLQEAFGETLFVADAPVTIHRVIIRAYVGGELVWTIEGSPGAGVQRPKDLRPDSTPRDKYGLPKLKGSGS
jgi:hypothetical protein